MAKPKGSPKTGGRKKGSKNQSTLEIKSLLDSNVNFSDVINKLVELVNGVEVQQNTNAGPRVYLEKPDSYAAKILLEYRFGKPQQSIDVTSGNQPITQNIIKLSNGTEISI